MLYTSSSLVSAQVATKSTCPLESVCTGADDHVCMRNLGAVSYVRLTVELNNNVDPAIFYQFCLKLDDMAQLNIGESGYKYMMGTDQTATKDAYVRLWLWNGSDVGSEIKSPKRFWRDETGTAHYAAFFSSVIALDNGKFFGNNTLLWDNSCVGSTCIVDVLSPCVRELDCAVEVGNIETEAKSTKGIRIFVAFTGYDASLSPMTSAGSLPTKYRAFAWSSYIDKLSHLYKPTA